MNKQRHKIVPSSYVLFMKDGKVLLGRRANTGYEDGKYGLPAGHGELGETFTKAAIREAMEEIGVMLQEKDLKLAHIMHRNSGLAENNERVDAFFVASGWSGNIENKEPEKCDDLSWFDLDNLPENIVPYIKVALNNMKNNIYYSEYGW
jgi:8-oxo-dGTP diphosphatase